MHTIKVNSCDECPCLGREPEEHDTPLKYVCGLNRELDFFDVDVIICIHKACPLLQAAYTIQLKGRTSFDAQTMNNPPADNPLGQELKKALEHIERARPIACRSLGCMSPVAPSQYYCERHQHLGPINPERCHHVYEAGIAHCVLCGAGR